jgi:hypothetical protein
MMTVLEPAEDRVLSSSVDTKRVEVNGRWKSKEIRRCHHFRKLILLLVSFSFLSMLWFYSPEIELMCLIGISLRLVWWVENRKGRRERSSATRFAKFVSSLLWKSRSAPPFRESIDCINIYKQDSLIHFRSHNSRRKCLREKSSCWKLSLSLSSRSRFSLSLPNRPSLLFNRPSLLFILLPTAAFEQHRHHHHHHHRSAHGTLSTKAEFLFEWQWRIDWQVDTSSPPPTCSHLPLFFRGQGSRDPLARLDFLSSSGLSLKLQSFRSEIALALPLPSLTKWPLFSSSALPGINLSSIFQFEEMLSVILLYNLKRQTTCQMNVCLLSFPLHLSPFFFPSSPFRPLLLLHPSLFFFNFFQTLVVFIFLISKLSVQPNFSSRQSFLKRKSPTPTSNFIKRTRPTS